jgi:nicotinamide mononucleotide (NMN) deamidase PncC
MLRALPPAAEPNVDVTAGDVLPKFASVKGFTGIFEGNNVTANHSELEPPDQGLAVHNNVAANVAAEINNNVVRFFNATTGAAMTAPIANSAFFQSRRL